MKPRDPDHRVAIADGWSMWRDVMLRSAGFTIHMLDELAAPELGAAIDEQLARTPPLSASQIARLVEPIAGPAMARTSAAIRRHLAHPRVREAILLQNRTVLKTGIEPLLRMEPGATHTRARRKEQLAASYLQRYCGKNDTVSFFGPRAWARISDADQAIVLRSGGELLTSRATYWEHWPIDLLARSLGDDPILRRSLPPRRNPVFRLDGTTLWDGKLHRLELPGIFARLLALCDGERTAQAIAGELMDDPDIEDADEVFDLLDQLAAKKVIFWTIEISPVPRQPEQELRRVLSSIAPCPARDRGLDGLSALDGGRQAIDAAAGDPDRLASALEDLDARFERVTGESPHRRSGQVYAGRTLVYQLAERNVELELGAPFIDRLGSPLSLILASARWFTWHIAREYLAAVRERFAALRSELDSPVVDYLRLWPKIAELFPNTRAPSPIVRRVAEDLQKRWHAVLAPDPGQQRVIRSAADLRSPVRTAFGDAPGPGWPWARYHSPDLLLAATSPDAIGRGDYLIVLGELHSALHSYLVPPLLEGVGHRARMITDYENDIEAGCVYPVTSRHAATAMDGASMSSRDFEIELGDTPSPRPRSEVIAVAELCAEEIAGRLVIRTRDGRARFDAAAFLSYYLSAETLSQFKLLPPAAHTPRIQIDHLVVSRERWMFEPDRFAFVHEPHSRLEHFIQVRRWAEAEKLPRRIFITVPEEVKPLYVDLASPVYVEMFARVLRKASRLSVSEMLPGPDQCWLVDGRGQPYSSEIRIAVVDPEPWRSR